MASLKSTRKELALLLQDFEEGRISLPRTISDILIITEAVDE